MSEQLHYHQPAGNHVAVCTLRPEVNAQGEAYLRGYNGQHMYLVTPVRNPVPGGPTHVLLMCGARSRSGRTPGPTLPAEAFADAGDRGMSETSVSALDIPMHVTFFASAAANDKRERTETLRSLAKLAEKLNAPSKDKLLWVKAATFGDEATDKGSLRHNANMTAVTGLEGDYDGGVMTPARAAELLTAANIGALIYTSPSHRTFDKDTAAYKGERWRVLCPLSRPHTTAERSALLARVNGVLGGVLAGESFTASQSYYIGGVGGVKPQTILVDGRPIDLAPELDATAIGRPGGATPGEAKPGGAKLVLPELPAGLEPDATALAALQAACALFDDPGEHQNHDIILAATMHVAPFVKSGHLKPETCIREIRTALASHGSGRTENDGEVAAALTGALDKVRKYEPPLTRDQLDEIAAERLAEAMAEFGALDPLPVTAETKPAMRLQIIRASDLQGKPVPEVEWIVRDWLPVGYTTLCYGDGGTGKTLLMEQLLTASAIGGEWLGMSVRQGKAFGFFCEDHANVIHHRQKRINTQLGVQFSDLTDFSWACPVGEDNTLFAFDGSGKGEKTALFKMLREQMLDDGTRLLGVDTAATTFGGNENDRRQVTAYVGQCLTSLAMEMRGAVVLNAHPSRAGLASDGTSGSTGWKGSCRSLWTFAHPKKKKDWETGPEPDPNMRLLTRTKANEAPTGVMIPLTWDRGYFHAAPVDGPASDPTAVFMSLLRLHTEQKQRLSLSQSARNYAPTMFARHPGADGHGKQAFAAAMGTLLADGTIRNEEYGPASKRYTTLVIV